MQALLLDLDDTLLDYSGGVDAAWADACQACGPPAGVEVEVLVAAIATARRWFWDDPVRHRRQRVNMLEAWQQIVAHAMSCLGVSAAGLDAAIARRFATVRRETMRLFPEARATLVALRAQGIPLGLVTNGDAGQQRDKIEQHDLAGFFDVIVIEGEFGAGKPEEIVYRHALGALGVAPGDAWMVGDNLDFDVDGPQRLGVRGVWLDRDGLGLPPTSPVRPHRIIRSLTEL